MSKDFITVDHSTRFVPYTEFKHYKKLSPLILEHKEGVRHTAQLYRNPCRDFPPSFYECERRSYAKTNIFDLSEFETREMAFHAVYGGHFYSKKEKDPFYEMSGKIYRGDKVVCLTRPELIREYENHSRFLRFGASLGKSSYFNQMFIPSYENHTTKTDTAVYCTPYKYSVPGFYEETDNTSSSQYGIYKSLRLQVRVNEPAYLGTPFDLKEHERLCEFNRNYCKDIKL